MILPSLRVASPPLADPVDLASAARIGVHSRCGAQLTREAFAFIAEIGFDDITTRAVADGKLDALIVAPLQERLHRQLSPMDIEFSPELQRAALGSNIPEAVARLPAVLATAQERSDLYIVLRPNRFGVLSRPGVEPTAHAVCSVLVFDARKQELVLRKLIAAIEIQPRNRVADRWDSYSDSQWAFANYRFETLAKRIGTHAGGMILRGSNLAPPSAQE